jgi:acetylornithine deacetylase
VRDELTELLARLVEIESVNPSLVPGAAGEQRIAAFVTAWAEANGLEADVSEATPGRPSVVVRARGRGGGRSLLLCGHLDTVGVDGMADPLTPRIEGDRLYGRGAYDMKAGVAAALIACRDAARLGLAGDVIVAAVADEEYASIGIQEVLGSLEVAAAIVTEPTELEIAVSHKGFAWIELEITGRAAHGSRPHLGIDAIVKSGPLLVALGELDSALGDRVHPLVGRGSVHASLIEGGAELSSYPASCTLKIERRTLPGETLTEVEAEIDELLEQCRTADPGLEVERRTLLARDPFEIDPGSEIVEIASRASGEATIGGASYWADSGYIAAAGIPTVLFGPGGEGAHAVEEWVSLAGTAAVARTLVATAEEFCA